MTTSQDQTVAKTTPAMDRKAMGRVAFGVVIALALGVGFSALGGYMVGDFASFTEPPSEKTYLVNLPDDENLLRDLSNQLMSTQSAEASSLNNIAPAAGSPLGSFSE